MKVLSLVLVLVLLTSLVLSLQVQPHKHNDFLMAKAGNTSETKCILCAIVVNEVEGLLSENITETEMEKILTRDVCNVIAKKHLNDCVSLVDSIPKFINHLDQKESVNVICVEENFCAVPFTFMSDPQPVPTYTVNLDDLPEARWKEVCTNPTYGLYVKTIVDTLKDLFPANVTSYLELAGLTLNALYYPLDIAAEIRGCASQMNIEAGWLTILNTVYEIVDACTSIVSQTASGKIYHARNMDFLAGIPSISSMLKNITFTAEFTSFGKPRFYTTTFAGYVGALSGMRPNGFSVSMDSKPFGILNITEYVKEIISELHGRNRSFTSVLVRKVLEDQTDFASAVIALSTTPLISEVYYIVGGVSSNQGVVITRNPVNATDIWRLNGTSRWYEVATNYDHWKQPPWYNDRVVPANDAMNQIGQSNLNFTSLLDVLSVKPVLNLQSTFTMLACPVDNLYTSLTRYCPYPCAE